MDLIFYDFETTGRDPHWDQILQVGATKVSKEFNEIDAFEYRCRLKPGLIPSPFALAVNNTDYAKLIKTECSHYEMLRKLEEKFIKWSPSIFIGYNSINFDEEFLRHSLFRALLDPYLTSRNNNHRADLLELLRTVDFFFPNTINVPTNEKKKKTFKLDQIAPANAINHLAHDAFGDVMATKQLAQLISKRKPSFWRSFLDGANKSRVYNTLSEEKIVFLCQTFYGKTTPISGTFLFSHPVYNFPVLFDLNYDPQDLIELNLKDLRDIYISGQKFLKFVKPNKGPILLKKKQVEDSWFFNSININEFQKRSEVLENASFFKQNLASMLLDIAEENKQEKELSGSQEDIMAEETLYIGGFPSHKDQKLKQQFKNENWSNRYKLCQEFSDKRFSYFGLRLIYEECPQTLPLSVRDKIERSVEDQLTSTNKEKWKTCDDFDKEIEIIENDSNTNVREFVFELNDIRNYFKETYYQKRIKN